MPTSHMDLIVTADSARGVANLSLRGGAGATIASHSVDFGRLLISHKQVLFDLRSYLRIYAEPGSEKEKVAAAGVFLAEEILGREIFLALWHPRSQRSLRVQLPGATAEGNPLGAAFTRIPWEIARPAPGKETLAERNLLVRVVHDMAEPATKPIDLGEDGCLRVLFVFAEAHRSHALSVRRERREIQRMFEREIYPSRKIVVDFLAHGVTRERLREQIETRSGYHVLHWSGHGHLNRLELTGVRGLTDPLSGEELVDLFAEAGGFVPQLVFLSACQSGDVQQVRDWQSFLAAARGDEPGTRGAAPGDFHPKRDIEIEVQPGYTGTAHALLQGGVPSVLAMRYAVGDEYARALAYELYRALFVHRQPKSAAAALSLARKALLDPRRPDAARFDAADHATAVLYGAEDPGLRWQEGRSPSLDTRDRRLQRIPELTLADHPSFVGRAKELADLGARFISTARDTEAKPVAVVTGLGGMGKTALAAEASDLWSQRFEWVLLYQAKPNALSLETTLRDIHLKLYAERGLYHRHVQEHPADALHREPDADFNGRERMERLTRNLARALRDEPILLVLDNFETNLKTTAEPTAEDSAEPLWACQDPDWDRCLGLLATELVGAPSRVLITCRHQLDALKRPVSDNCLRVRLSPLPPGEATLYLREHDGLSRMIFGKDEAEKALAQRLLQASRFHPLLMDRLARLATGGPELRAQLLAALDAIETNHGATQLPELFATRGGDAAEMAYLENALASSIDELIRGASPDARRLLWMVAVANEPVALGLILTTWNGPNIAPLLRHLVEVGLVTEERIGTEDENPELTCHELICERIRDWMGQHPEGHAGLTEASIRLAYAERLEAVFRSLWHQDRNNALEAGRRALVYCVQAQAWGHLENFASGVITSSNSPALLRSLNPHLKAAAEAAPEGKPRWTCLTYLADALRAGGQPDASIPFYEQAAAQARRVAEVAGDGALQAWSDRAWILANWANALRDVGALETARQLLLDSAESRRMAGDPEIWILSRELEALRIEVLQGRSGEALRQIESRLERVQTWWERNRSGQPTPEAPDPEVLARALIGALDIAMIAHMAQKDWKSAVHRVDAILAIKQDRQSPAEEIASSRMNRANALARLGRIEDARIDLEACLVILRDDPICQTRVLGSLADLFDQQGDVPSAIEFSRRALALSDQLPFPIDRASVHNNLAAYLERSGLPTDRTEAPRHSMADLIYCLVAGLNQDLQMSIRNFVSDFRRSHAKGTVPPLPRLAEILADPAFRPLEAWLCEQRVDLGELQLEVDLILESIRKMAVGAQ